MLKSLFRARLHARLDQRCGYQGIGVSGSGYQGIRISGNPAEGTLAFAAVLIAGILHPDFLIF
jgi:hypothetical protein